MEQTEYLLQSEIARLVYGELIRMNSKEIAEEFLNTSPHMKECVELKKRNRSFSTKAHNRTLEEIFDEFLSVNELLLNTVNDENLNTGRKFHDPVEAFKFMVAETGTNLVHPGEMRPKLITSDEEVYSDICLDIRSSPDLVNTRINYQTNMLSSLYNSTNNIAGNGELESNIQSRDSLITTDNRRDILHRSSVKSTIAGAGMQKKVKTLLPRKMLPVAGKKIPRTFESFQYTEHEYEDHVSANMNDIDNEIDNNRSIDKVSRRSEDTNSPSYTLSCPLTSNGFNSQLVVSESFENASSSITSVEDREQIKSVFKRADESLNKTDSDFNLPEPSDFANSLTVCFDDNSFTKSQHFDHVTPTKEHASFTSTTAATCEAAAVSEQISPKRSESCSVKAVEGKSTKNFKTSKNKRRSTTPPKDNCKSASRRTSVTDENVESTLVPINSLQLIQQKLVEHEKFQKRLARNINVAINESPHKKSASDELDNTIAKVANETIDDPLCKKIIAEILNFVDEDSTISDGFNEITEKNNEGTLVLKDTPSNAVASGTCDRNSRYPEMNEFVTFNNDRETAVINIPMEGKITGTEGNYVIPDEISMAHSSSVTTYVLAGLYPKENDTILQFPTVANIPIIAGMGNKETKRKKLQPLGRSQSKKFVPIAPKPTNLQVAEVQECSRNQSGNRTSRKTRK